MPRNVITSRGKQVRIEGLAELQNNIANLMSRATGKEVKKIWMQAALELRDQAIDYAPIAPGPIKHYEKGQPVRIIEPGALKAAIFAAYGDESKSNVLVGVHFKPSKGLPGAPHAWLIEFGSSKMAPQPYMRPALTACRQRCISLIADGYRQLLIDNDTVPDPSSRNGGVPVPGMTQGERTRQRLIATYASKRAQGLVPAKRGFITVQERARRAAERAAKRKK